MGFFDVVKKGAELASKGAALAKTGLDKAEELRKKKLSRMSDSALMAHLDDYPNDRWGKEEAHKRGL